MAVGGSLDIDDVLLEASQKYEDSVTSTTNCEELDEILLQASQEYESSIRARFAKPINDEDIMIKIQHQQTP